MSYYADQNGVRLAGDATNVAPSKRRLEPYTYDRHHSFRHGGARLTADAVRPTVTTRLSNRTTVLSEVAVVSGVSVNALWKTGNTWTVSSSWAIPEESVQNIPTTYKTRLYIDFDDIGENTTHDIPDTFGTNTASSSYVVSGIGAPGDRSGTCRIEFIDTSTTQPFAESEPVLVYFNDPTIQSVAAPYAHELAQLWNRTPFIRIPLGYINISYPGSSYTVYAQLVTNVTDSSEDVLTESTIYTGTDPNSIAGTSPSANFLFTDFDIYKSRRLRFRVHATGADASVYSPWTERFCFPPQMYLGNAISVSLVPSDISADAHRLQLDTLTVLGPDANLFCRMSTTYRRRNGTDAPQSHTSAYWSILNGVATSTLNSLRTHNPSFPAKPNERFYDFKFHLYPAGWLASIPTIPSSGYWYDWGGTGVTGNIQTELYYPDVTRAYISLYSPVYSLTANHQMRVTCSTTNTNFPDTDDLQCKVVVGLDVRDYDTGPATYMEMERTERVTVFDPAFTYFGITPDSITQSPGVYWGPRVYTHTSTKVYGVPSSPGSSPLLLYTAPAEHLVQVGGYYATPGVSSFTVEIQNVTGQGYDVVLTAFDGFTAFTPNDHTQYYTFVIQIVDTSDNSNVIRTATYAHPRPSSINWYPVSSALPYTILSVARNSDSWFGFGGGSGAQTHAVNVRCGYFNADFDPVQWVPRICGDAVQDVVANVPSDASAGLILAFHNGPFNNFYNDGDLTTATANLRIFDNTPVGNYSWGTLHTRSTVNDHTTYTFSFSTSITADILVLAGGGAGGERYHGGGGGAGGLLLINNHRLDTSIHTVSVARGAQIQSNGFDTVFTNVGTAIGGGRGGTDGIRTGGFGGGSGGGAEGYWGKAGGTGTTNQGNNGGDGYLGRLPPGNKNIGGGGGGAGGLGASEENGGHGGAGLDLSGIFGTTYGIAGWFGGGGGGGGWSTVGGNGGVGGGGLGGNHNVYPGNHGVPNTGAGGGGAGTTGMAFGKGGSGIVLIKW